MQTTNGKTEKGQIARSVRFDIATNKNDEFQKLFRNEILPTLKKQDGFKDELLLVKDQHVLRSASGTTWILRGSTKPPPIRNWTKSFVQ